jgi:hypothetical protein
MSSIRAPARRRRSCDSDSILLSRALLLLPSPSLSIVAAVEKEDTKAARVFGGGLGGSEGGYSRFRGAGPGVEGGDGMAAARGRVAPSHDVARLGFCGAGSVADTGGAAVLLPCRGARTGEARGDASEGGAVVTQAKGGVAVSRSYRGAEAGASRGRGWRWKGKLTSGPRLSAAWVRG